MTQEEYTNKMVGLMREQNALKAAHAEEIEDVENEAQYAIREIVRKKHDRIRELHRAYREKQMAYEEEKQRLRMSKESCE